MLIVLTESYAHHIVSYPAPPIVNLAVTLRYSLLVMAGVVVGGLLVARLGGIARPASTRNLKAASKPRTSRWNSGAGAMGARASSDATDLKLSDGCKGAPLQPGTKLPIPGTEEMMAS